MVVFYLFLDKTNGANHPPPKFVLMGGSKAKPFGEGVVKSCKNLGANHPPLEGGSKAKPSGRVL